MKPTFCWHHARLGRLMKHLKQNRIDLYGPNEKTEKGTNRQTWWLKRMKLKCGERIRIVVKGQIVAEATIDGYEGERVLPYPLPIEDQEGVWKSFVKLREIELFNPPKPASCYKICQGSHRLNGKGPCS